MWGEERIYLQNALAGDSSAVWHLTVKAPAESLFLKLTLFMWISSSTIISSKWKLKTDYLFQISQGWCFLLVNETPAATEPDNDKTSLVKHLLRFVQASAPNSVPPTPSPSLSSCRVEKNGFSSSWKYLGACPEIAEDVFRMSPRGMVRSRRSLRGLVSSSQVLPSLSPEGDKLLSRGGWFRSYFWELFY